MKKSKKLTLNKETLRTLDANALRGVVGGIPQTCYSGGCMGYGHNGTPPQPITHF